MTSRKRSSKKKTPPQSSSCNPCTNEEIVPNEEFEVEQEEKEAYWDALCGSITPPPEVFYPTRSATQLDPTLPSRTSPVYLKTLREFYKVPSGVVFRVPNADFSFLSEVAEMSGLMDGCAQAESMVPPIEGGIQELWEPIEVSEDMTEAGADAADERGEVDQPADSFGVSMSGYLDLDLRRSSGLFSLCLYLKILCGVLGRVWPFVI
ncbi:hypothetical protein F2Q70_00022777 [Brassica cretica]|uniref:Uncharacterized protein n=1 Tax=Brassica cretica TaxID=69181 RepID=A0A8S9GMT9_BRACR|nr:hypothetical protein F2Q70_00022777 [Brassica cretica]